MSVIASEIVSQTVRARPPSAVAIIIIAIGIVLLWLAFHPPEKSWLEGTKLDEKPGAS